MSDTSAFGFGKFVPGFDFLQNLAKSASAPQTAGSAIPGMSSWVAPTLSVEELDKRIQELKAVQFWLEQNGTALKATIQALEVQKMTLTTLQGMNVNMAELAKAFTARPPEAPVASPSPAAASPAPAAAHSEPEPEPTPPATASDPEAAAASASDAAPKGRASSGRKAKAASTAATVDPMQWWGSLTQQFQNIATAAMQDAAAQALQARTTATAPAAAPTNAPSARAKTAKPQSRGAKTTAGRAPAKGVAKAAKSAAKAPAKSRRTRT